jgi:hypothetical protein
MREGGGPEGSPQTLGEAQCPAHPITGPQWNWGEEIPPGRPLAPPDGAPPRGAGNCATSHHEPAGRENHRKWQAGAEARQGPEGGGGTTPTAPWPQHRPQNAPRDAPGHPAGTGTRRDGHPAGTGTRRDGHPAGTGTPPGGHTFRNHSNE